MAFDPRTAMLDKDKPPWLDGQHAEPRAELSPEQRGPREPDHRKILTVNVGNFLRKLFRRDGQS